MATILTVTSAAGDPIQIIEDNRWVQMTHAVSDQGIRQWTGIKPLAFRELWQRGAVIEKSGRATSVLHQRIREANPDIELSGAKTLTTTMNDAGNAPAFEREINGKRCFSIRLVSLPQRWYDKLMEDLVVFEAIPIHVNGSEPSIGTVDEIEPSTEIIEEIESIEISALDLQIASQVAMQLLTTVVEIISAGKPEMADAKVRQMQTELETVSNRLGARLDENERFRRQIRELGDELSAVKLERDGLRRELRATQANLTATLKGEKAGIVTAEVQKAIDQVMRSTPQPHRGE
jgi:regulator of replication initiation timing